MRIIECDRCHKRFKKDAKKTGYVNLDQRDILTGELDGDREFDDWDVCDDCMQKIRDFVRMVPPKEEKPKATIKKMPVQGKTIAKPDWIRRLAGEGKTVKEIDITKVTPLEAMNILYGLIEEVKAEDNDGQD